MSKHPYRREKSRLLSCRIRCVIETNGTIKKLRNIFLYFFFKNLLTPALDVLLYGYERGTALSKGGRLGMMFHPRNEIILKFLLDRRPDHAIMCI